jgi:hypothetical protein
MNGSTKIGIIVCSAIIVAFSLSVAFAGNERGNATKAMNTTNATKIMTNATINATINITYVPMNLTNITKNITYVPKKTTNATESFAKTKSYRKDQYLNSDHP